MAVASRSFTRKSRTDSGILIITDDCAILIITDDCAVSCAVKVAPLDVEAALPAAALFGTTGSRPNPAPRSLACDEFGERSEGRAVAHRSASSWEVLSH